MDDKDLVKRTRNSLRTGMSRAQIMKRFQERGYRLEYAEAILDKAKKPKMIFLVSAISLILLILLSFIGYGIVGMAISSDEPLEVPPIIEKEIQPKEPVSQDSPREPEIEVTPELISYVLQSIGALDLHRNPLTLEKPMIGLSVGDLNFYSRVGSSIETFSGANAEPDIQFSMSNLVFKEVVTSENPEAEIQNLISQNKIVLEIVASEAELFSKGYLKLYNSLK
jgi:hypothetical protein